MFFNYNTLAGNTSSNLFCCWKFRHTIAFGITWDQHSRVPKTTTPESLLAHFPADGNYALPILTVTNREVTTTAGWSRKKNVVTQAEMHCIQLGLHAPCSDAGAAQLWNHPLPPPAISGNMTALAFLINGQYNSQKASTSFQAGANKFHLSFPPLCFRHATMSESFS